MTDSLKATFADLSVFLFDLLLACIILMELASVVIRYFVEGGTTVTRACPDH